MATVHGASGGPRTGPAERIYRRWGKSLRVIRRWHNKVQRTIGQLEAVGAGAQADQN
jgi:hypothetical protein